EIQMRAHRRTPLRSVEKGHEPDSIPFQNDSQALRFPLIPAVEEGTMKRTRSEDAASAMFSEKACANSKTLLSKA
ncbi:MAG: hypothetical protein OXF05_04270, partial [Hyphomicrobiales bacterium]|nr:hypothetical protein [Hyphomicrobiales bacterium]